jgi:hypothetical protein
MITKTLKQEYLDRVLFALAEALPAEQQPRELAEGIVSIALDCDIDENDTLTWIRSHGAATELSLGDFASFAEKFAEARAQLYAFTARLDETPYADDARDAW